MNFKLFFTAIVFSLLSTGTYAKEKTTKIGYANFDYILSFLPEAKKMELEYQNFEKKIKENLQKQVEEFQKKLEVLQKGYTTMTDAMKTKKQEELQQLKAAIEASDMKSQELLNNKQMQLLQPIYEKINKKVEDIAKRNNYTHIFNANMGGMPTILYAEEKTNISDLVLKELGVTMPKDNKKAKATKK